MGKILRGYVLREIAGGLAAGIALFSSILFLLKTLDLLEMIFARGVPAGLVARLLAAIVPSFLEATIPMAFLLGIVVALGRLAADGEAMALRAAGIGIYQVLPPVLALASVLAATTLVLSMTARPWGHSEVERTLFEIARTRAHAALRPRFFNPDFENMVVYVDRIDRGTGELFGILVGDERGSDGRTTVFAQRGILGGDEDSGRLHLRLLDGTSVASSEMTADYDVTSFRSLEVQVELRTVTGAKPLSDEPATMTWPDLRARRGDGGPEGLEARVELQRRFAMAAAPFGLALLGCALGLHSAVSTRGRAIAISLACLMVFYALLTLGIALARSRALPVAAAVWIPNIVLYALAAWSVRRVAADRTPLPVLRPPVSWAPGSRR
jgi:lipopolysaccharide export system permease protein